jgi:3D (Asp-Asp-Asp) domain-containing protein
MESPFGGSAVIAATLLSTLFFFSAASSVAELPLSPLQQQRQELASVKSETKKSEPVETTSAAGPAATPKSEMVTGVVIEATDPAGGLAPAANPLAVIAPVRYMATAYCLKGRTASGKRVTKGLIAADPSVLPLGTRVRLEAGTYSGEYLVADTGGAVRGKRIDIWTPTGHEAMRFGRRTVKLTVLSYGPKRILRRKLHRR